MDITEFHLGMFSLADKNVVITGGNTGLGQAFTLAVAKAGANVFVPSVMDDDPEFRGMVEAAGVKYTYLRADITQPGMARQVITECVETYGSIDVLINCAGICKLATVEEFGREQWDPMIGINLTAPFELGFEASKFMIAQGSGKIINIASVFTFLGGQWSPAYAATKHGIAGFTKAYCDELAQHGIQVNAIAPGYFATALTEATRSNPETNQRVLDHIPAGRWGEVADLMGATVFLASAASDYVNGTVLSVDGGYLVR